MVIKLLNLFMILTLTLVSTISLAAQLEAIPDRTNINLEQSFSLQLRASGSIDGEPDLSVLEKDFELLGRSESSQIQIINGEIKRSVTWNLTLLARSTGDKTIPALCIDNQCSAPVVINVLPAGQTNQGPANGNNLLLEVDAQTDRLYVQSELVITVRLLTRLNIVQASLTEPEPTGVEAVVQKLGEDRNYETRLNGLLYQAIERKYAIFPQQSGQMTIPPIRFDAQISDGGRGGFDPFNRRTRQMRKRSNEITVEVLPANDTPAKLWLPARNLQLIDDWQEKAPQMTVGEPATRTLTLLANGLPSAQFPELKIALPDGVKSYPDKPAREDQFDENGIIGVMQQKLALVPTQPGSLLLPEVEVEWWDTQSVSWRQATLPAIVVEVLPAVNQPEVAAAPPTETANRPQVDEKPGLPPSVKTTTESGFWSWLSLALGSGWLVTLFVLFKIKTGHGQNRKSQEKEGEVVSLKKAQKALQEEIKSGDANRVRGALLEWGAALFPKEKPGNLEQLSTLCGNPLSQQLESFNKSMYSRNDKSWDTQALLMAIQQTEQDPNQKQSKNRLPPLYAN